VIKVVNMGVESKTHHEREEKTLFPRMERKGITGNQGGRGDEN